MRKGCLVVLIAFGFATTLTRAAQNSPASRKARVYRAEIGRILASGANATKPERLARFLRSKGTSNSAVNSLRILSESSGRNGVTRLPSVGVGGQSAL